MFLTVIHYATRETVGMQQGVKSLQWKGEDLEQLAGSCRVYVTGVSEYSSVVAD